MTLVRRRGSEIPAQWSSFEEHRGVSWLCDYWLRGAERNWLMLSVLLQWTVQFSFSLRFSFVSLEKPQSYQGGRLFAAAFPHFCPNYTLPLIWLPLANVKCMRPIFRAHIRQPREMDLAMRIALYHSHTLKSD